MIVSTILRRSPVVLLSSIRQKTVIDYSKVPQLLESDLEEQFVRGSGPGGQATNKTANCVVLKHLPTGLVVKNHESRSLHQNRKTARERLAIKLDNFLNGEQSIEAQRKLLEGKKSISKERKKEKLRQIKAEWKKSLSDPKNSE